MKVKMKIKVSVPKDFTEQTKKAIKTSLEFGSLAFERTAKIITTEENHVVTGRYRASINLNSKDGVSRDTVPETQSGDGIHEFLSDTKLVVGSNVEYAIDLEKKYSILARALDSSTTQIRDLFITSMRKELKGLL